MSSRRERIRHEWIRQFAHERDISERTAWRWVKRMIEEDWTFPPAYRGCANCGEPLPERSTAARIYCTARCRVAAARARNKR